MSYTPGVPVWHQIPAVDVDRAKTFYSALFPWKFRESSQGQSASAAEDRKTIHFTFGDSHFEKTQAGGGIQSILPDEKIADDHYTQETGLISPTVYYYVDDLDDVLAKVEGLGGKVLVGKTPEGSFGEHAVLRDTEGNAIAVYSVKK